MAIPTHVESSHQGSVDRHKCKESTLRIQLPLKPFINVTFNSDSSCTLKVVAVFILSYHLQLVMYTSSIRKKQEGFEIQASLRKLGSQLKFYLILLCGVSCLPDECGSTLFKKYSSTLSGF